MKAWAKRMIWFFGMFIVIFLNDIGRYLLEFEVPEENKLIISIIWLLLFIVPIILIRDD